MKLKHLLFVIALASPATTACESRPLTPEEKAYLASERAERNAASSPQPRAPAPAANPNPVPEMPTHTFEYREVKTYTKPVKEIHASATKLFPEPFFKIYGTSSKGDNDWWVRGGGMKYIMGHVDIHRDGKQTIVTLFFVSTFVTLKKQEAKDHQAALEKMVHDFHDQLGKDLKDPGH